MSCLIQLVYSFLWKKMGILFRTCLSVGWSVDRLVCRPSDVHSISFDLFAWKLPELILWMALEIRKSLLIFRSQVKVKCWSLYKWCFLDPFVWKFPDLVQWMPLESRWPLFASHMVKDHGQTAGLWKNVLHSMSLDPYAGKLPNLVQWMSLL